MSNAIMVSMLIFAALIIGNKIGHDAGRAIANDCPSPPLAGGINCTLDARNCLPGQQR